MVKILAVSDRVDPAVHSAQLRDRFGDVHMVLACGDLPYLYLEYIATVLSVPCYYVHGNHDQPQHLSSGRTLTEPGGWVNLDQRTAYSRGVLLAGLEGSIRYRPRGAYQYTETEMGLKVWRLVPALLWNRLRYGRYLDVLITHAPPFGIQDGQDPTHRGFRAFLRLMARFRPRYLLHGHQHMYEPGERRTRYLDTDVVNVYRSQRIEW